MSRLTSKAQTTIPHEVRDKLSLRPGDTIVYEIEDDGTVRVRKQAPPMDIAYLRALRATLSEWETPEDARPPMTIWERCTGAPKRRASSGLSPRPS